MATGCAGHDEAPAPPSPSNPLGQRQQEVRNGIDDNGNAFAFVGRWVNSVLGGSCSAILITPVWVLTAGHCVTGSGNTSPA
ncbi:MAG: trypsin-like serine protease, partial [Myxococcales bacterium]|nr:trypsin-like serine protease [Myxococcales bacterium]